MIYYYADSFKAFCYYFLQAPGGFNVMVTGKSYYTLLFVLLSFLTIGIPFIPFSFAKQYKTNFARDIVQQMARNGIKIEHLI